MTFLQQLIADAQPKAETIKKMTKHIATNTATKTWTITKNIGQSPVVKATVNLGYKSMVNTLGIGLALSQPAVSKAKEYIKKLADQPTTTEQK